MTAKVVTLDNRTVDRAVQASVIEDLEEILAKAKAGEVNGIAIAYDRGCSGAPITTVLNTNGNHIAMGQALSSLWFRFQQLMLEDAD